MFWHPFVDISTHRILENLKYNVCILCKVLTYGNEREKEISWSMESSIDWEKFFHAFYCYYYIFTPHTFYFFSQLFASSRSPLLRLLSYFYRWLSIVLLLLASYFIYPDCYFLCSLFHSASMYCLQKNQKNHFWCIKYLKDILV